MAMPEDAPGIACVHVRSWQAAYRGQLPDAMLDALSVDERTAFWRALLGEERSRSAVIVAEVEGVIAGFASAGPCRDIDLGEGSGEIYALYVAPEAWSAGIGRALMEACLSALLADGFPLLSLWVIESNQRARAFYERTGWRADGARKSEGGVAEVRYVVAEHDGPIP
jgi:ribosomal protein S18 acetylase RimI-like enzyme